MSQLGLGLDLSTKRTRKREFLDEMRRVVPWSKLIALIEPHYPAGKTGRPPFPIATMLQIHFMQQWFGLSDPAMEEALYDVPLYREFAGLDGGMVRLPDESTILRFRHLLETHGLAAQMLALVNEILTEKGLMLKAGSAVDATLDCRTQFDKERFRHPGSRNALDAERRQLVLRNEIPHWRRRRLRTGSYSHWNGGQCARHHRWPRVTAWQGDGCLRRRRVSGNRKAL
ncbi:Transposase domain [Paraburkholderia diazotrophica]|uniref:Transposase domain n=1 Tax=Paraburkholderia diazotrophica TaxID=667676 RepID=A0A1H7EJT2_9BURK|nr:Transposase domain [Paraburkholderia diazotrophica]